MLLFYSMDYDCICKKIFLKTFKKYMLFFVNNSIKIPV